MKTIDVGKYYIKAKHNSNIAIELKDGNMLLALKDGMVTAFDPTLEFTHYDAVFFVHLLESDAELAIIYDSNSNSSRIFHVHVSKPFVVSSTECEIIFECSNDSLEEVIYAFKNNQLIGDYDIKSILMQYVQKKEITKKQAVYYIVTTIDVPEVEGGV